MDPGWLCVQTIRLLDRGLDPNAVDPQPLLWSARLVYAAPGLAGRGLAALHVAAAAAGDHAEAVALLLERGARIESRTAAPRGQTAFLLVCQFPSQHVCQSVGAAKAFRPAVTASPWPS